MLTRDDVRRAALALPEAYEEGHFDIPSFRVAKKIFCTVHVDHPRIVLKLTPDQQAMVVETDPGLCSPVPGGWGHKGWTSLYFDSADSERVRDLIGTAWRNVAPKKLVAASFN